MMFLSILLLIIGYSYAYIIFPENIIETNTEYLTNMTKKVNELAKESALIFIFGLTLIIFINNAIANLLFLLPFIGPLFYTYSIMLTGAVLRYFVEAYNQPIYHEELLISLMCMPHTYIEFLGYSIAVTESIYIAVVIIKRSITRKNMIEYLKMLGLSYLVLAIAALIETITIHYIYVK